MIWSEMLYNKINQSFFDKLYLEPDFFDLNESNEVKEVTDEFDETSLSLQCWH